MHCRLFISLRPGAAARRRAGDAVFGSRRPLGHGFAQAEVGALEQPSSREADGRVDWFSVIVPP